MVSHWDEPGRGKQRLLWLLAGHRVERLLMRMLDETEFLSAYRRASIIALSCRSSLRVLGG